MKRQIVKTGGQGLASSQAAKAALGAIVVAVVVLLIFFFLDRAAGGERTALGRAPLPSLASVSPARTT